MSAEVRILRTAAEEALIERFPAVVDALPGRPAVRALREAAHADFARRGLPHRRVEAFKYTDLRALMPDVPPPADPEDGREAAVPPGPLDPLAAIRLVLAGGVFRPDLSGLSDLATVGAIEVLPVAEALEAWADAAAVFGTLATDRDNAAVALNTAYWTGGVAIRLADGARIERPIEIAHVGVNRAPASVTTRCLVFIGAGAKATLYESFASATGAALATNALTEIAVGEGAELRLGRVQEEPAGGTHLSTLALRLDAHAHVDGLGTITGGGVSRVQIYAGFAGEYAKFAFRGYSLLKDRQHGDTTLVLDHAVPHCESRELFRSVVDGRARAVFQGRVLVRPGAQKTDAAMLANGLLLSSEADVYAKPELEIFADDVSCSHGATAGELDENLKFYLLARGIPPEEAELLLITAFLGEVTEAAEDEALARLLEERASAWLRARSGLSP